MALETCAGCSTRYAVGLSACPNCRSTERRADAAPVEVPLVAVTACMDGACPVAGVQRRVVLPRPVPGVVELPLLLCARCGGALPLAWPGPIVEDDGMSPKITAHGGPTNAAAEDVRLADGERVMSGTAVREHAGTGVPMRAVDGDELEGDGSGEALPPVPDEEYGPDAVPLNEGGEESSPGSNSSTSTEKPSDTPETSKAAPRKRTRAANRSTKGRTGNSSPGSPATSGPETDAPTDDSGEA